MVGAKYDFMDPDHMKWMSTLVQNGRYLYCPEGSHLAMWDDQKDFYPGIIKFIRDEMTELLAREKLFHSTFDTRFVKECFSGHKSS